MTQLQIDVQYGEYHITFTTVEDRTVCNLFLTDSREQILSNKTIPAGPKKDIDFYLAGVEIFAREAIQKAMRDVGGA